MPSIRVGETFSCLYFGQNDVDLSIYIAAAMGISVVWVKKIWARYRNVDSTKDIVFPFLMGRPKKSLPGRREHSAVVANVRGKKQAQYIWNTA